MPWYYHRIHQTATRMYTYMQKNMRVDFSMKPIQANHAVIMRWWTISLGPLILLQLFTKIRHQLMDTWNSYDKTVSEPLYITTFPNMVDNFMLEGCGTNSVYIRWLGKTWWDSLKIRDANAQKLSAYFAGPMFILVHSTTSWQSG
jgi:hypothetical protein